MSFQSAIFSPVYFQLIASSLFTGLVIYLNLLPLQLITIYSAVVIRSFNRHQVQNPSSLPNMRFESDIPFFFSA